MGVNGSDNGAARPDAGATQPGEPSEAELARWRGRFITLATAGLLICVLFGSRRPPPAAELALARRPASHRADAAAHRAKQPAPVRHKPQ